MKFLSNSAYDKLLEDGENGRSIKALEKAHKKELRRIVDNYNEQIEDITDAKDRKIHSLQRKADKAVQTQEDAVEDAVREATENHDRDLAQKDVALNDTKLELTAVQKTNTTLEKAVKEAGDLKARELDLSEREAAFTSREAAVARQEKANEERSKELDALKKEIESDHYNKGYTDGVSDTLREGNDLSNTANERVFNLANKALDRDTTVITTTQAPAQNKK